MTRRDQILSVHHIGARNGGRNFPITRAFESEVCFVLYDADAECIDEAREVYQGLTSELHAFPFCLGAKAGKAQLNLHFSLAASSLRTGEPDMRPYYFCNGEHDYP